MPISVYVFLLIELIFVAYLDFIYKKVSNYWVLINIMFLSALFVLYPNLYNLDFKIFIYPFSFLTVGFILYLMNLVGGGDAKYLFSLYFLIPLSIQKMAMISLLESVIFVGSILFLFHSIINVKKIYHIIVLKKYSELHPIYGKKFIFIPIVLLSWIKLLWQKEMIFIK